MIYSHFSALGVAQLAAYGLNGAEMLTHQQRLVAWHALDALSPTWSGVGELFRAVDGHYPPLLHLVTAALQRLVSLPSADVLLPLQLNLVFLVVTVTGVTWQLATAWPRALSWKPEHLQLRAVVAAILVMLAPGLAFPARRYYYDLPMTLLIVQVTCILTCGRGLLSWLRAWLGAVLTLLALCVKWAAGLYLLPVWLGAIFLVYPSLRERRWQSRLPLLSSASALLLAGLLIGGWMPESLAFQLGLAGGSGPEAHPHGSQLPMRSVLYVRALAQDGLGLGMAVLLFGTAIRTLWTPKTRGRVVRALSAPVLIVLFFVFVGPVADGRYLMPILPGMIVSSVLMVPVRHPRIAAGFAVTLAMLQLGLLDQTSRAGIEPWQEWWWTSAAESRSSRLNALDPVAEVILAKPSFRQVIVFSDPGQPSWEHLLAYALELRAPGRLSVMVEALSPLGSAPSALARWEMNAALLRWSPPPAVSGSESQVWQKVETGLGPCWLAFSDASRREVPP